MPNQLAVGATGGAFTSLLLGLSKQLLEDKGLECVCPTVSELCPTIDFEDLLDHPNIFWLFLGILIGILSGPLLDILWLLRGRWRRFVSRQIFGLACSSPGKPTYRVVYD